MRARHCYKASDASRFPRLLRIEFQPNPSGVLDLFWSTDYNEGLNGWCVLDCGVNLTDRRFERAREIQHYREIYIVCTVLHATSDFS